MALVNLQEMLKKARHSRMGVACINTPSVEFARATIAAAEEVGVPVILAHAEAHDAVVPMESLAPSLLAQAQMSTIPVAIHVDHGVTMEFIMRGVRAGFTSVMYDCSRLPVEENIRRVSDLVELVGPLGVSVEAELGEMPSSLNDSHDGPGPLETGVLTDPAVAARFVEETNVDALAVSFGTSHGLYTGEPNLDFTLLREIDEATGDVPLVMHGSSGLPIAEIGAAIKAGISKVNYYSHLAADSAQEVSEWIAARRNDGAAVFHHEIAGRVFDHAKEELAKLLSAFKIPA